WAGADEEFGLNGTVAAHVAAALVLVAAYPARQLVFLARKRSRHVLHHHGLATSGRWSRVQGIHGTGSLPVDGAQAENGQGQRRAKNGLGVHATPHFRTWRMGQSILRITVVPELTKMRAPTEPLAALHDRHPPKLASFTGAFL